MSHPHQMKPQEIPALKREVLRKYANILQVTSPGPKPKNTKSLSVHSSPREFNQLGIQEKFSLLKNPSEKILNTINTLTTPNASLLSGKKLAIKIPNNLRMDNSSMISPSYKLPTFSSEALYTLNSPAGEKSSRRLEDIFNKSTKNSSMFHSSSAYLKIPSKDQIEDMFSNSMTNRKSKMGSSSYREKEITLEDLFNEARGYSLELKELMNQEYEQTFEILMKNLNVKEFGNRQRDRIDRVIMIIEKAFVNGTLNPKDPRIKQEIWRLVQAEIGKVQSSNEKFLYHFEDIAEKMAQGKRTPNSELKPWQALQLIIQKSADDRASVGKSESFSVYDRKIYEFKIDYKLSKNFSPKILEAYELMENYVKELNQIIQTLKEEQRLQTKEHELLNIEHTTSTKRHENFREEVISLIHGRNAMHPKQEEADPEKQQKALKKTIDELTDENLKFFNDAQNLKKEVKDLKNELKKAIKSLESRNGPTYDKGIMVDLYSPNTEIHKTPSLLCYIKDPELCINASKLSKEMAIAMINMLLSDKQFTDLCDDFEGRPRKPMNKFIVEWFLKRFGLYRFTETMIKDFILSIHTTVGGQRYRTFRLLLGMNDGASEEEFMFDPDRTNQLDREKLKKLCFGTTHIQKCYFKIIKHIRVCCGTNLAPFFQQHNFGPFLADVELSEDQLNVDIAKSVLGLFIKEENLSTEEIRTIEEHFYLLVTQHQMSIKLSAGFNNYEKVAASIQSIGMDMFVKFLLEVIVEKRLRGLERYYTTIKGHIITQNYADISYDEFSSSIMKINPDTTQTWIDHCFADLMTENVATKTPLHILMESFVDSYLDVDKVKGSMQQKPKAVQQTSHDEIHGQLSSRSHKKYKKGSIMRTVIPAISSNTISSPVNTLPSPTNLTPRLTPRPRILNVKKEAMSFGTQAMAEKGYELYDAVSSLIVLQETYGIVESGIREMEKENDLVSALHDEFVKDMEMLPKKMSQSKNFDELLTFGKDELVDYLESLWAKLRGIMVYIFRTG